MSWNTSVLIHLRTVAQLYLDLVSHWQRISVRLTSSISMTSPKAGNKCL